MEPSKQFYRNMLDSLTIGIYFVDPQRRITFWNKGAERITGFKSEEMRGTRCPDSMLRHIDLDGTNLCKHGCPLSTAILKRELQEADVFLHHKQGHRVPIHVQASPMFNEEGQCIGAVEVFQDNSPKMVFLDRISELQKEAYLDPLTGLANRRYAERHLQTALAEMERLDLSFGVISLDIDNFKHINDTYGHAAGDRVLKMVAEALRAGSRSFDFIARWGGEEFLCVAVNINADQLQAVAERLRLLVEGSEFKQNGDVIRVTVSAGAALYRPGETITDVLQRADELLYESKAQGKNRVSLVQEMS